MQISNVLSSQNIYQPDRKNYLVEQMGGYSSAVTKSETTEREGERLGTVIRSEYSMVARLSKESTPDKPIVQVFSTCGGKQEVFDVDINRINPGNASRLEMFALCCYADKCGMGTGSTFGSFHTLMIYEDEATLNGCMKQTSLGVSTWEQFQTEKINWSKVIEDVLDILKTHKDPKVMDLFAKGKKLSDLCSKYTKRAA